MKVKLPAPAFAVMMTMCLFSGCKEATISVSSIDSSLIPDVI